MSRAALVGLAALAAAGCDPDFERMIDQPKLDTYEPSPLFADGSGTRTPPRGTVHRGAAIAPAPVERGLTARGAWVTAIPVPIDRAALARGHDRYMIMCTPCHGPLGDGDTPVARDMTLRPPPSLIDPVVSTYPPGRIYQAITEGYGLMPSYADRLSVTDRWAVVAFLGALRLSQRAALAELPPALAREARAALDYRPPTARGSRPLSPRQR
jgi:mono/diheme cytochrome c family protein